MEISRSKITSQGQISVPAEVRKKLGVGPGSILEWQEDGDKFVVRRLKTYTSEEMHRILFPNGPPARRTLKELKEGIAEYIQKKHARR